MVTLLEEFEVRNIILDRIDRAACCGGAPRFIERRLQQLSASTCKIKILLVVKPRTGMDWDIDLTNIVKGKGMYLATDHWDQEVVTLWRRKRN